MPPESALSDLQLAIMRILWDLGEATTAEVQAGLESTHALAPTTVATLLRRLEQRGVITHRTSGRQFVYRAVLEEHKARRSMTERLTDFFFAGSPAALVSHLVDSGELQDDELAELKRLIAGLEEKEGHRG